MEYTEEKVYKSMRGGTDKAINKMKKHIGIEKFEAELILIDPKDKVKEEDDEKRAEFCKMLM